MEAQSTQKKLTMQALGAELTRLRKELGMSRQDDLSVASSVSTRLISDIENGNKIASQTKMRAIENALGLPPGATDDFMAGKIKRLVPERSGQPWYPSDIDEQWKRDLWDKLRNRSESFRRDVIEAFAESEPEDPDSGLDQTG